MPDARDIVEELTAAEVKLNIGGSVHDHRRTLLRRPVHRLPRCAASWPAQGRQRGDVADAVGAGDSAVTSTPAPALPEYSGYHESNKYADPRPVKLSGVCPAIRTWLRGISALSSQAVGAFPNNS